MEHRMKRKRSANFTLDEQVYLVDLVTKYRNIIENKKSNHVTWHNKNKVWKRIEAEFNATMGGAYRASETLRSKYENLKINTKKLYAASRKQLELSGGDVSSLPKFSLLEEKVIHLLTSAMKNRPVLYDSDAVDEHDSPKHTPYIDMENASDPRRDYDNSDLNEEECRAMIPTVELGSETKPLGVAARQWNGTGPSYLKRSHQAELRGTEESDAVDRSSAYEQDFRFQPAFEDMSDERGDDIDDRPNYDYFHKKKELIELQIKALNRSEEEKRELYVEEMKERKQKHEQYLKHKEELHSYQKEIFEVELLIKIETLKEIQKRNATN